MQRMRSLSRASFARIRHWRRYLDHLEMMHREVIAEGAARPVDRDELIYCVSRSFRPFEAGVAHVKGSDHDSPEYLASPACAVRV